jgi:hypothetical protein
MIGCAGVLGAAGLVYYSLFESAPVPEAAAPEAKSAVEVAGDEKRGAPPPAPISPPAKKEQPLPRKVASSEPQPAPVKQKAKTVEPPVESSPPKATASAPSPVQADARMPAPRFELELPDSVDLPADELAKEAHAEDVIEAPEGMAEELQEVADAAEDPAVDDLERRCPLERSVEMKAMVGKLTPDGIDCLEQRYETAMRMTTKDKVSRVLIANAFGRGDMPTWEQRVARHLKDVSQGDPDMCYKYAAHIFKRSPGRHAEVVYWSNRALENRHIWKGDAYVSRVYALHKMRTNASLKSWEMAGEHFATTPTTEAQRAEELARIETKTYAREWIDYSAKAGRDAAPAVHLCLSASGDKGFCATN